MFCIEYAAANITVHITIPTQSDPVPLKSVFGWIIIHQRLGYTFDWNLIWAHYKGGFGSIDADFWLGLQKLHLLTSSQPYRLRVEVQERSTNLWYSAEYWSFKIRDGNNVNKYRLEVSGYSGDAGDSLQYEGDGGIFNHIKFTAIDQDNDNLGGDNCASSRGGAWWYNACSWACLTCHYDHYEWHSMGFRFVVNSRMMIKLQ